MGKKLSYEYVKQAIESEGYKLLSKEYISAKSKLSFICPEGHLFETTWDEFSHNRRCPYCSNHKVLLGYNTIWDKARWMVDLGVSEEDAKKYTPQSNKYITVICPNCGERKVMSIDRIYETHSIGCSCGDGRSYPEKIMYSVLKQLNINFKVQLNNKDFDWCNKYKYDFYLEDYNIIIETHGKQHYIDNTSFKISLKEQQEIDNTKKILALNNGINKYIIVDCSKSNLEFIKNSILNSELNSLFDLYKTDWNICEEYSLKNIVKEVCDYWHLHNEINNEGLTTKNLCDYFNLSRFAINCYLKKGTKLGWCNYNGKEEMRKNGSKHKNKTVSEETRRKQSESLINNSKTSKQVYQYNYDFELVNTYLSTMDAERKTGFYRTQIGKCCNNKYGKNKNIYKGYIWSFEPLN